MLLVVLGDFGGAPSRGCRRLGGRPARPLARLTSLIATESNLDDDDRERRSDEDQEWKKDDWERGNDKGKHISYCK